MDVLPSVLMVNLAPLMVDRESEAIETGRVFA